MRLGDVDWEEDGGDEGAEDGAGQEVGEVCEERRRAEVRREAVPDALPEGDSISRSTSGTGERVTRSFTRIALVRRRGQKAIL